MPKVFNRDIELSGTSRIVKGSTVIVAGDGTVPGATPADGSITTAKLASGAVTDAKMEANNVSGVPIYGSSGVFSKLDCGVATEQVLKSNGSGAAPTFDFLFGTSFYNPGLPVGAGNTNAFGLKIATAVYDFATDGGAISTIVLDINHLFPVNSIIFGGAITWDVLTTCTSATDAATIQPGLETDGFFFPAFAISNGTNPWDAGVKNASAISGINSIKTTGARNMVIAIAVESVTAGKIQFFIPYMVGGV